MGAMASQITSLTIVYSTVCSGADESKHQSSASLAFVRGILQWPVNSPHKWPVARKMFPFDDVVMLILLGRVVYRIDFCVTKLTDDILWYLRTPNHLLIHTNRASFLQGNMFFLDCMGWNYLEVIDWQRLRKASDLVCDCWLGCTCVAKECIFLNRWSFSLRQCRAKTRVM